MSPLRILIPLVFCTALCAADAFTGESLNEPFVVHGRLSACNGTPSLRIWIVGSKRILGIAATEGKEGDAVPKALLDILQDGDGWFNREFYGDFTVDPIQPDQKGRMRMVRILSVKNLVVVKNDEITIIQKAQ